MSIAGVYGPADDDETARLLDKALEIGVNFWDTANVYGGGRSESSIGAALAGRRDDVVLATKLGAERESGGGRPASVVASLEASLQRLRTDRVDLLYLHRVDPTTPIEETVGAMAEQVTAGKVRQLGLSEVSVETLQRAHAVHPIAAVQSEYSLFSRDPETAVVDACRSLGATFVAYSLLGRGVLSGALTGLDDVPADDWRRQLPRFSPANFQANEPLVKRLRDLSRRLGATPAQAALAWLLHQDESLVAIPGTRRPVRMVENAGAADLRLTDEAVTALAADIDAGAVAGRRAMPGYLSAVDR